MRTAPSNKPKPEYNLKFLEHGNIQQKSTYLPGQVLLKTWKVLNNGEKAWNDCELIFVKGNSELLMAETTRFPVPPTEPECEATITAMINTPTTPGRYKAVFRMQKLGPNKSANGTRFGPQLFIDINVVATQEELQAAVIKASKEQAEKEALRRAKAELMQAKMSFREAKRAQSAAAAPGGDPGYHKSHPSWERQLRSLADKVQKAHGKVERKLAKIGQKMDKAEEKGKVHKLRKLTHKRDSLKARLAAIESELAKNTTSSSDHEDPPEEPKTATEETTDPTMALVDSLAKASLGAEREEGEEDMKEEREMTVPTFVDPSTIEHDESEVVDLERPATEEGFSAPPVAAEAPSAPKPATAAKPTVSPEESYELVEKEMVPPVDEEKESTAIPMVDLTAAPTAPEPVYEHQDQLNALLGMGFKDENVCRFALDAHGGHLDQSVQMILKQLDQTF